LLRFLASRPTVAMNISSNMIRSSRSSDRQRSMDQDLWAAESELWKIPSIGVAAFIGANALLSVAVCRR
jgi:hypothetical protein